MASTYFAKCDVVVAAVHEWQRGAITLAECQRRCDLTDAQSAILFDRLYGVSQYTSSDRVRVIAAKAVSAPASV